MQLGIVLERCALTRQDDDVQAGQDILMTPETFPDYTFDAVSSHRTTYMLFRDRQTQTGSDSPGSPRQDGEASVVGTIGFIEYRLEGGGIQ